MFRYFLLLIIWGVFAHALAAESDSDVRELEEADGDVIQD